MPSEMLPTKKKTEISMRHTKLKASEAALLAGELNKPSWESRNEGIHERISFEDSIWGFDLAGGSFYKTPLRVTAVKPDSRAEKAGIRPGDRLLRINDIDTSTLTIQEAHEIIVESGIHLKIAVTSPDDYEDSYHCWEDPLESGYDSEEERRLQREKERKREVHAKVSSYWSLQWPWVSKRRVIYRESNCFMVPSKYEDHHRDKFPVVPTFGPKIPEDIVLHSSQSEKDINKQPVIDSTAATDNGETKSDETKTNLEGTLDSNENNKELKEKLIENHDNHIDLNANSEEIEVSVNEIVENGINGLDNISDSEKTDALQDDEVIDQVLFSSERITKEDEESVLNDILSDNEIQENSESMGDTDPLVVSSENTPKEEDESILHDTFSTTELQNSESNDEARR